MRSDLLVATVDGDRRLVGDRPYDAPLGIEQLHDRVGLGKLWSALLVRAHTVEVGTTRSRWVIAESRIEDGVV